MLDPAQMTQIQSLRSERLLMENDRLQFILDSLECRLTLGNRRQTPEEKAVWNLIVESRLENARNEVRRLESMLGAF